MLNDISTLLIHLATRRSVKPRDLGEPGPSPAQLHAMIVLAARTPDHGKLAPWRFVEIGAERRGDFANLLRAVCLADKPDTGALELDAINAFAHQAPTMIAVLSTPVLPHKIPVWEQQLSAGAAAMNLLHGAHAYGFVGGWVTGWAAYHRDVATALGCGPDDRIAGFVFIGTPKCTPVERARPEIETLLTQWHP